MPSANASDPIHTVANPLRVLVVEDDRVDVEAVRRALAEAGRRFKMTSAGKLAAAFEELKRGRFDVILLDLSLPDSDGLQSVDRLVDAYPETPIVVLTGYQDEAMATDAVRRGAQDYLQKDRLSAFLLKRSLAYAIERQTIKQQLQAANRAKSEFLRNMSHELRTPLTAVLGFSQALRNDYQQLPEDQRLKFLDSVVQNGEHLLSLVDDLLDLAKIEASRIELHNEAASVSEICSTVESTLGQQCDAKGLSLVLDIDAKMPAAVHCDPLRLQQVLLNLVGNAVKFTDAGGVKVGISASKAVLPNHYDLAFEISDTGIGVEEASIEKLTQPFEQIDSSLTRNRSGAGLGLAICKRLIELMGGTLEIESEPGVGSRFRFTLHVLSAENAADANGVVTTASLSDSLAGRRILLVEDNPDTQRLVKYLIQKLGAELEICNDGQHALERLLGADKTDASSIDLVLMDMQMPVLDGYRATERLREAGVETPIIALTAHSMHGDRKACLDVGCDDYISKPFDSETLAEKVQKWSDAASRDSAELQTC